MAVVVLVGTPATAQRLGTDTQFSPTSLVSTAGAAPGLPGASSPPGSQALGAALVAERLPVRAGRRVGCLLELLLGRNERRSALHHVVKASVGGMGMALLQEGSAHPGQHPERHSPLGRENGQLRCAAGEYGVVAAVALVEAGVALLLVGVVMVRTVGVLVLVGVTWGRSDAEPEQECRGWW